MGRYLETMTWTEAEKLLTEETCVVFPIGARSKEHGHHLPLNTDWLTAEYLTKEIVKHCDIVAMPAIPYGYYPAFIQYPGSTHIQLETFKQVLKDLCNSLHRHGPKKFYFLNNGVSTNWALEPARLELQKAGIDVTYTDLLSIDWLREMATQPEGTHADEMETSLLLHIHPEVVAMEKAIRDIHPKNGKGPLTRDPKGVGTYSPTGVYGDPTLATKEKGKKYAEKLIEEIIIQIETLKSAAFTPPDICNQYL